MRNCVLVVKSLLLAVLLITVSDKALSEKKNLGNVQKATRTIK